MLDEPTAGMSRFESRETVELLRTISREQGLTLVFTEHDMDIVFGISEKIVVLQQGSVIADGTPAEIKANPEVRKAYLGEEIRSRTGIPMALLELNPSTRSTDAATSCSTYPSPSKRGRSCASSGATGPGKAPRSARSSG